MDNNNGILDELRGMGSPLAALPRTMPYRVPDGYFTMLPDELTKLFEKSNGLKINGTKGMPFNVPEDYFDMLPLAITTKMNEGQSHPMLVPEGYFESFPDTVLEKAKAANNPSGKTRPFGGAVWSNLRWAAAAILVMGIGVGSYRMYYNTQPLNAEKELATLPASDINDYIKTHLDEFDADMIAGTLGSNGIETINTNNINDDEIQQFLDESGNDTVLN